MSVRAALSSRRSARAFLATPVAKATVVDILQAASRAPSGTNMQPWKVYVLAGETKKRLSARVLALREKEPFREGGATVYGEYIYNPEPLFEPYVSRRRKVGWDLYRILGVAKGDKAGSWRAAGRNFEFFGAPIGMIFTIDRRLEKGSWLDYGMFIQSIMLAARDYGLDTCAQAAWRHYHDVLREDLQIPDDDIVVCGLSLGYADLSAPANTLKSEREPLEGIARFVGDFS